MIVAGLVVGLLASFGLIHLMSSSLPYGVLSHDGVTLLAVALILTITAMLSVYIPAQRAVCVDPNEALRYE